MAQRNTKQRNGGAEVASSVAEHVMSRDQDNKLSVESRPLRLGLELAVRVGVSVGVGVPSPPVMIWPGKHYHDMRLNE